MQNQNSSLFRLQNKLKFFFLLLLNFAGVLLSFWCSCGFSRLEVLFHPYTFVFFQSKKYGSIDLLSIKKLFVFFDQQLSECKVIKTILAVVLSFLNNWINRRIIIPFLYLLWLSGLNLGRVWFVWMCPCVFMVVEVYFIFHYCLSTNWIYLFKHIKYYGSNLITRRKVLFHRIIQESLWINSSQYCHSTSIVLLRHHFSIVL